MIRSALFAALLSAALPVAALAQTADDLKNDYKTTNDVLMYGMGYNAQRFSPLKQINRDTVKRLVPAWAYSLADNRGDEAQAVVRNGVIYLTDHIKTVAVDVVTGKEIWKSEIEYPPETTRVVCCGIVNRGAVLYDGKLYRTTLDGNILALDQKTGKEIWRTKAADPKEGYSLTVAPMVAHGVVIFGVSGAEFGMRGFLDGYDAGTGEHLWRTYTIPAAGEPGSKTWGDVAHPGGGSGWITGSYDPQLDLVYWGIGNPSPWSPSDRKGDNLFTNSMFAIRPQTGQVVWYYQMTPEDPFDYDGVNELVLADLKVDGKLRKVAMQANRNGFLYVVDRTNGQFITAHPFTKVTWATGIDKATGRPIWSDDTKAVIERGEKRVIFPAANGGKNWMPMSFSPLTGLLYINTIDIGWDYQASPPGKLANLKPGDPSGPGSLKSRAYVFDNPNERGALKAIDPATGRVKWQVPGHSPNMSGTLVTAGDVVFTGKLTGELAAYDAQTGKQLWQFQTPSGIVGQPVTFEHKGTQYVTVTSGTGGVYVARSGDPFITHVPAGGTLWTFKLFEENGKEMKTSQR